MSNAWNLFVIALIAFNLLGCAWLLWWTAKRRPGDPKPEDTSHYWDGDITEYNKPMPRWWINGFFIAIVFAIGYLFWFGGLGTFPGLGHWSSKGEYAQQKAAYDATLEATFAPFKGQSIDVLAGNPEAVKLGRSIFNNTCATCHGSSAKGAIGYPNLTDQEWKWGGSPDQVLQSVLDGRDGVMPSWGPVLTGMDGENAVDYVVAYVHALGQPDKPLDFMAVKGKALYEGVCVACHGPDGKGNQQLGAPDLTDSVWLYGGSNAAIHESIANGRHGVMPAHRPILGETRSRLAAAYVWSLSHPGNAGKMAAPATK
ncbi:MAG: cytochrome-c oxidase, cbb3-type subunit III [Proteobacteria bacterium]|nr:cytochrome-c oxidase, cbb3-type subunit III [Pseudomonadota bacterium]